MSIENIVRGVQVLAIVDNQWGDTGKGKYVDFFAHHWADVIARGTGGANAGHTVIVGGQKRVFHLLPSGITSGKPCMLGNGMVIHLPSLVAELDELESSAITLREYNLIISGDAHIVMPWHIEQDERVNAGQTNGGIGSTGRGIGPCYADKIARRGIRIRDVYDTAGLRAKVDRQRRFYAEQGTVLNIDDIIDQLHTFGKRVYPFVRDTLQLMQQWVSEGRRVLLEGAQGLLLSSEFGTYPFVTSSDCSAIGTAQGVGLPMQAMGSMKVLGVVKFPYMTRVGAGPFPTELGKSASEIFCGSVDSNLKRELEATNIPYANNGPQVTYDPHDSKILALINNSYNEFMRGRGIRLAGGEYGATTGRCRRTGWTDLVALKYAVGINGPDLILTKADVLRGAQQFAMAHAYEGSSPFVRDAEQLRIVRPIYKEFDGFDNDISQIKDSDDLPPSLLAAISFLEQKTGGKVRIISTGPEREQNIFKTG